MIILKLILSTFLIVAFISIIRFKFSDGLRLIEKSALIIFSITALTLIIVPSLLQPLSRLLGLQARAILLYTYIIFSSWFLFRSHLRINLLNYKCNKLISEISILTSRIRSIEKNK